jgi:hypothetical protein
MFNLPNILKSIREVKLFNNDLTEGEKNVFWTHYLQNDISRPIVVREIDVGAGHFEALVREHRFRALVFQNHPKSHFSNLIDENFERVKINRYKFDWHFGKRMDIHMDIHKGYTTNQT